MYGLIKKDLLMLKQSFKIFLLMFIVFFGMTIINESDMTFILPFMSVMISLSTFSYDNYNKWDAYAITLPNGRKNVVLAKYISTLIMVLVSFLISLVSLLILHTIGINIDILSSMSELTICLFSGVLIISIMFPVMYKFGIEKGRIILFILTFGVTGIALLLSKNVSINIPSNITTFLNNYVKILFPTITLIFLWASIKVSQKFYSKKEF